MKQPSNGPSYMDLKLNGSLIQKAVLFFGGGEVTTAPYD